VSKTGRVNDDGVRDQKFIQTWRTAAKDLGIDVVAPFVLQVSGGELRFEALLKGFGSRRNGILYVRGRGVTGGYKGTELLHEVYDLGYGVIHVMGDKYADYDRSMFVDELNDWGWQGDPIAAPDWYTGESSMIG